MAELPIIENYSPKYHKYRVKSNWQRSRINNSYKEWGYDKIIKIQWTSVIFITTDTFLHLTQSG